MILVDTGPLISLLNNKDPHHNSCVEIFNHLPEQLLITTWPCFTEAMYLLSSVGGFHFVSKLWKLYHNRVVILHDLSSYEINRKAVLMEKYHDTPMDLAEASLIAMAESYSFTQIFTLDSDFNIYRLENGAALELLPKQRSI